MELMNVSEARKNFSKIVVSGETVEVRHPKTTVMILPKSEWEEKERQIKNLELALLMKEMDRVEALNNPTYTTEQVEQLVPCPISFAKYFGVKK
ncbi:hypothetical protein WDW89_17910 [Deltaproteobacteria bacterium TL4]